MAPVVAAFAPPEDRDKVVAILQTLVADELRHISYTALFMEEWATAGHSDRIRALYEQRLRDFDKITADETEGAVRDLGNGRFPDLLALFCCGRCADSSCRLVT